ncbi:MAG: hypothetical protein AAGB05_07695 [Pseudomonadota bacterium]
MPHDGNHPEPLNTPQPAGSTGLRDETMAGAVPAEASRWQPTWSGGIPSAASTAPVRNTATAAQLAPEPMPEPAPDPAPFVAPVAADPQVPRFSVDTAREGSRLKLAPDFGHDSEHPQIAVPFTLRVGSHSFHGQRLSVTHLHTADEGGARALADGSRHLATLTVPFDSFSVTLQTDVILTGQGGGMAAFQFADPTGPHLPQLRYILNTVIAGDFVSVDGLVTYSGPTEPAKAKAAAKRSVLQRVRSLMVALLSICLLAAAAAVVAVRYTTGTEMHPVFVERAGQQMRATVAGQMVYLDPSARQGEVLYAINSNAGDVLNFRMPCDCDVEVAAGMREGTTVLPTDKIMTIFNNSEGVRAQTLMSIEGLSRAMSGDLVHMDLSDGRRMAVTVLADSATTSASMRGDLFVPVELVPIEGALTQEDVGKTARVRLSHRLLGVF